MSDTVEKTPKDQENRGGKRRGAGRPKGSRTKRVVARELREAEEIEILRERFRAQRGPLFDAQIQHAIGISHFFLRDKGGKFDRITDPDVIADALSKDEGYYIFTKDPSAAAFKDIADRVMGKSVDVVDVGHSGTVRYIHEQEGPPPGSTPE